MRPAGRICSAGDESRIGAGQLAEDTYEFGDISVGCWTDTQSCQVDGHEQDKTVPFEVSEYFIDHDSVFRSAIYRMEHTRVLFGIILGLSLAISFGLLMRWRNQQEPKESRMQATVQLCMAYYSYTDVTHQTVKAVEDMCNR